MFFHICVIWWTTNIISQISDDSNELFKYHIWYVCQCIYSQLCFKITDTALEEKKLQITFVFLFTFRPFQIFIILHLVKKEIKRHLRF